MNSENITNIPVKTFKVQGLDLIITTPDGKTEVLKDGLSDIILGNIALSTEQGDALTQDEILSSISMNVGADAVYIKEQFVSETVDIDKEGHNKQNDTDDIEKQFEDTFAKLQQQNKELANAVRELESTNKEQTAQLSSSLTKLNQAKNELNQKNNAEKNKTDIVSQDLPPPPMKMPTTPTSSSSSTITSSPVDKAKDSVIPIKTNIFIQGQLDEALISGISGSQITNSKTLTFFGKVSLDATAYLEIAGTKYAITADNDGKWTLQIETPFNDGAYKYKLVASRSGETPVIVDGDITIDTFLSDVTVSLDNNSNSGAKHDNITHHTRPTFSGTTEPNSTVTFLIAGQSLSATANAQGVWRVTVNNALPDGESTYHVTATDKAGNSQSTTGSVMIKTTLPDATTQLEGRNDFLTNKSTLRLIGKTDANATLEIHVAGQSYTTTADERGDWTFHVPETLRDGSHILSVTVTDIAGNVGTFTEKVQVDTASPNCHAALRADTDTGVLGDQLTHHTKPILVGTTKPEATVTIQFDGQDYPLTADATGGWSWQVPTALVDNVYDYQVTVTDLAGNTSTGSGQFEVDSTLDSVSVVLDEASNSGEKHDNITHHTRPTFSGTTEPNSTVTFLIAGQSLSATANAQGVWRVTVNNALPDGESTYHVTATDKAGNSQSTTGSVMIKTTLPDATTQLEGRNDFLTNKSTLRLIGKTDANATLEIHVAGQSYTTTADERGDWAFHVPETLRDGSHILSVTVTDIAGNVGTFTEKVQVDTASPNCHAALRADTDTGVLGDQLTHHTKPILAGTTKPEATVTIQFDGQDYPLTADATGGWSWQVPTALVDNVYDYQVTVTDLAGNTSTSLGQFEVDTEISLTANLDIASQSEHAVDGITTNLLRPQISGTSEPKSKIVGEFKGVTKTVYCDEQGNWSLTFDVNAKVGKENQYRITAEDSAGNQKTLEQAFTFIASGNGVSIAPPPKLSVELSAASDTGKKQDHITNLRELKFEGISAKGAEISFEIGNETYKTIADSITGQWEIKTAALADGNNNYSVTATNPINGATRDINGSVFVDSTLPFSTVELTSETDTGIKGNFITSHTKPVFSGKSEANCEVTLTLNGQSVSTTTDQSGLWSLSLNSELPKEFTGDYAVSITDVAGNTYETKSKLVIENSKPDLSAMTLISSWKNDRTSVKATNDLTPTLTGKVSPNVSLELTFIHTNDRKKKYTFPVTNISKDGVWTFQFPAGILKKGIRHSIDDIDVIATSPAGNTSKVSFDRKGFWVKKGEYGFTSEVSEDTSSTGRGDKYLSATNKPKLQGSITGSVDRDEIKGTIFIGGKSYPLEISDDCSRWSFQVPNDMPLSKGEHNYTLEFNDIYGSKEQLNSYVTVSDFNFWLDPITDSGKVGDFLTNCTTPVYKGKATIGASISARFDGNIYPIDVNEKGEWTFNVPTKGDGRYDITFIQSGDHVIERSTFVDIDTSVTPSTKMWIHWDDLHKDKNDESIQVSKKNEMRVYFVYEDKIDNVIIEVNGKKFNSSLKHNEESKQSSEIGAYITLPNGEHIAKVIASDLHGNITESEYIIKVLGGEEGEQPPKIDFGLNDKQLISADGGKLNFNNSNLKLVGKTSPASLIEIKDSNGKVIGFSKANNEGSWSISLPKTFIPFDIKNSDEIPLTVTAKDLIGRETHLNFDLIYDITPPEITAELEDILSLGNQTNDSTPTLSGQTKANADVYITLDGKEHKTTADSVGHWQLTLPDEHALKDGVYDYQIKAVDVLGQASTYNINNKIYIKTTPRIEGRVDANSDSGIENDNYTNNQKPKLSGVTEPNADVRVIFDGNLMQPYETRSDPLGNWSIDVNSELAEGKHEYVVMVDDKTQGIRGEIKGELIIDLTPPTELTAGIWSEQEQSVKNTVLTNITTPTFKGHTEPFGLIKLSISKAGSHSTEIYQEVRADKQGNWQFILPISSSLDDGKYIYHVAIEDSAGNLGEAHTEQVGFITVDTQPPELIEKLDVNSDSGMIGDNITRVNTPVFSGTTEAGLTVWLNIGAQAYSAVADQNGQWHILVTGALADQQHDYVLTVEDAAGNQTEQKGQITVDTQSPDLTGVQQSILTNKNQPVLAGKTEAGLKVMLAIDGKIYHDTADQEGNWRINIDHPLFDETHDYVLTVEDAAGNQTEQKGQITVDTQAPDLTGVQQSILTNKNQPVLAGKTEAGLKVMLAIDGKTYHDTADQEGNWRINIDHPLFDETHDYVLTVEDAAGNQTEQKGQITVDTQAPDLTGVQQSILTNKNQPVLAGKTEAGLKVMLAIDGKTYHDTADQEGNWRINIDHPLFDETHDYVLTVEDAAGNQTEQKGQITVDTQSPELFTEVVHISINEASKSVNMTFSGVVEPKSTISIKLGNDYYENIHGDDNGSWSHTIKDQPMLDSYSYQLEIKDSAGNVSIKKDEINLPQPSVKSPTMDVMPFEPVNIPEELDNYF